MDRLKPFSRSNYRHVWKAHPEMHISNLAADDQWRIDQYCNNIQQEHACSYHKSKSDNAFVVVSIDGIERNGSSGGSRDQNTEDAEGVHLDEPAPNNPAGTEKELQVHGLSRECSYEVFPQDKWEVEGPVKEEEEKKKKKKIEQEMERSTKMRAGSSFDFGVSVDPPTQLIGSFLKRQRESGGNALDMGLDMEFAEQDCTPRGDDFTCRNLEKYLPLSPSSEKLPSRSEEASEVINERIATSEAADSLFRSSPLPRTQQQSADRHPRSLSPPSPADGSRDLSEATTVVRAPTSFNAQNGTAHFRDYENSQLLQGAMVDTADEWTKLRTRLRNKSTKGFKSGERTDSSYSEDEVVKSPVSLSGVQETFNRQNSRLAEMAAPAYKSNPMSGGIAAGRERSGTQLKSHQLRSQQLKSGGLRHTGMLGRVEEEDDPFKDVDVPDRYRSQKWNHLIFLESVAFLMIAGALVCSTVVQRLRRVNLWGLNLWKWVVLALVIVCGRLVSSWIIRIVVFFLERSFLLRKKVLYFVYGLRRGVQNCLWLSFVLLTWHFVFDPRVQQATKALIYVTKVLQCLLIAAAVAMVKTLLVKVLASSFHVDTYFERIRDSLYNQYVLETLSRPPLFKAASLQTIALQQQKLEKEIAGLRKAGAVAPGLVENISSSTPRSNNNNTIGVEDAVQKKKSGFIGRGAVLGSGGGDDHSKNTKKCEAISVEELNKMSRKNISAWNMKRLVNLVKHTGVVTLADNIHDDINNRETEVNSEWQAKIAGKQIFNNVAKPGCKYIDKDDLLQFVSEDEVGHVLTLFDAAVESGKITAQALKDWTVNVYRERRALALSLCDTKTAVIKLHRFINCILFMLVIIIWLLVLGIATTHLILFLSSQLLLVVFVFGNTCKTIFEAIIFLFVMHPFDVGDRCVIDGNQLVVEEMNILTTVFLGDADVKIWYPNSVLTTKPIQNFYRSPHMGDNFDFTVSASTPAEKIAQLKERIGRYIQCKSNHWKRDFTLMILDIVDMHQLKLSLGVTHMINHQEFGEKMSRKSDLLWEMKKIFEHLRIEYHLQPQEIILRNNFPTTYL